MTTFLNENNKLVSVSAANPLPVTGGGGGGGGGDASAANQVTGNTRIGDLTEAAPASDTASSGLNGRLQRVAQRLTSLIALFPASLGSKAAVASLAVTASTEDIARVGIVTETAPATDTASSGLNGRLQRVAQRLTSLIALFPTALGRGSEASSLKVAIDAESFTVFEAIQTAAEEEVLNLPAPFPHATRAPGSGSIASATSSTQLLAANSARIGGAIVNDSTAALYIKLGTAASATSFDYYLAGSVSGVPAQMDLPEGWTGVVYGIWASVNGAARVSERTA